MTPPRRRIEVRCGPPHGRGEARIAANLLVRSGDSEYRHPALAAVAPG